MPGTKNSGRNPAKTKSRNIQLQIPHVIQQEFEKEINKTGVTGQRLIYKILADRYNIAVF